MQKIMIALAVGVAMLFPAFAQTKPKATVTFPTGTKDGCAVGSSTQPKGSCPPKTTATPPK